MEEKLGASTKAPTASQHTNHPVKEGIAGFHPDPFAEDLLEGSGEPDTPGDRRLDPDPDARVDAGTGDQLGNTGGSLTGTPPEPVDTSAPQAPDNSGSTSADLDHERSVGMSGGLREEG